MKHRARCAIFFRARHAAARVAPDRGSWQAPYHEPRGSAPRERDHRGGDHPVPSRTRQLSPPSPRVLQLKAAGGQGVALAEGAFLCARRERPAGGCCPLRASLHFGGGSGVAGGPIGVAAHTAPARHRGASRHRRGIVPCGPLRVLGHCPAARLRRPISASRGLGRRRRMRDIRRSRCRGPARRGVPAGRSFVRALRACSVLRCMRSV